MLYTIELGMLPFRHYMGTSGKRDEQAAKRKEKILKWSYSKEDGRGGKKEKKV